MRLLYLLVQHLQTVKCSQQQNVQQKCKMQGEWKRSDFLFQHQLGVGSFGIVYKAYEKVSEQPVAIKVIHKNKVKSGEAHKRLQRQIQVHSRLKHSSICRLYGYFEDERNIYLVLQYCANGNLSVPIKLKRQRFSDKKIASIFHHLLKGIAYMSIRNVMHRDIKLQNILFDQDYNPKLTDFGCCVHTTQARSTVCGTIEYLCPQMIKQEMYGTEVDLYCLGIVLYELFYFKSPFYDSSEQQIYRNIKQGVIMFDDQIRQISQNAKNLIKALLNSKQNRPQIREILEHPFILENREQSN